MNAECTNPVACVPEQNSKVWETVERLTKARYPALPVAPKQDPYQYHRVVKDNPEKGIWAHCLFNKKGLEAGRLEPEPWFTGKNPSWLDSKGSPHLLDHHLYQDRLPTQAELKKWFANPANGVGTLGGWNDTYWIDLDLKQFDSQQECDQAFAEVLDKLRASTWTEKTHSGGYRIAVKLPQEPGFTNFALEPGGLHRGEVLGKGRFTVLAPTIGPSGNSYTICRQRHHA